MESFWKNAIREILAEERVPMRSKDITRKIIENNHGLDLGNTPENTVNKYLRENKDLFKRISRGEYGLVEKSVTAEKSDAPKTGSHVSLRDLVLACIETIGRKYFEAKELYAFAPIFKACMPHCPNLEEALKQELHELVKEHLLDTLPDDCYCVK